MTTFSNRFFDHLLNKDPAAAGAMLAEESAFMMSDSSFITALHCASQNGYAALVFSLLLLMNEQSINAFDAIGETALHAASDFRHQSC